MNNVYQEDGMTERQTGAWVPWVVSVCCVVLFAVGIGALVVAENWTDRAVAAMVIVVAVACIGGARRAFAAVRSR